MLPRVALTGARLRTEATAHFSGRAWPYAADCSRSLSLSCRLPMVARHEPRTLVCNARQPCLSRPCERVLDSPRWDVRQNLRMGARSVRHLGRCTRGASAVMSRAIFERVAKYPGSILGLTRAQLIRALEWNDRNGCYSDADMVCEFGRVATDDELRVSLLCQVIDGMPSPRV